VRTFRDPAGSNKVGLIAEIPDFAAFEAFMKTTSAAAAVRHDGVRLETMCCWPRRSRGRRLDSRHRLVVIDGRERIGEP
jgi:hypothetical protein